MFLGLDKLFFWKKGVKSKGNDEYKHEPNSDENKITSFKYPINGGSRSSSVSTKNSLVGKDKEREIFPEFSLEWISILRHYSVFDRNVGRAVNNSVALAQTSYKIELPDNLSKRDRERIMETIRIFEKDAKIDSFTRNALRTTTYAGGLAVDAILLLNPYPSAVKRLAIMDIATIRFNYNSENDEFIAKQVNIGFGAKNEIILRKETFFYECVNQLEENPYPVPALLAAMEDIATQKEMLDNFKIIIQKLGMMGFLEVLVNIPKQNRGESDEAFYSRCETHIAEYSNEIEKGLSNGYAIGYEGSASFKMNATNINFGGAEKAFEIINRLLNNGLNTDGVFMNQNNNTSETFARVLLQVLIGNIDSVQKTVASVLSGAFLLHLKLKGFHKLDWINVVFEKPLIGDSLKEAQTESINIANAKAKEDAGYISNDAAAQELGHESATGTKKETPSVTAPKIEVEPDNNTNPDKETNVGLSEKFKFETDFQDDYLNDMATDYTTSIEKKYEKAVKKVIDLVIDTIKEFGVRNESDLVSIFLLTLEQNWETLFIEKSKKDIEKYTQKVYNKYRKDKSIFEEIEEDGETKNTRFFDAPVAIIDFLDLRLIEYLASSDMFYLGKFILADSVKQKMAQAILDFYVANDGEIGNSKTLDEFRKMMTDLSNLERYKIRRVVDTTMTNTRNYANINYLRQAEIQRFRRVEIGDKLTCPHCKAMDGETFETQIELTKVNNFVNATQEQIEELSPFATTIKIDEFRNLSASEKQEAGFGAQALHPHCRGRIVAVL